MIRRRQKRDEAAAELGATQDPIRRLLVSLGPEPTLADPTPRAAPALAREVRRTLDVLERLERHPPSPLPGVHVDPQKLTGRLEPRLAKLDTLCDALIGAEAAGSAAQARADRATADADRVVPCVARGLVAFCRLAGMEELGERIRKLARR